MSTAAREARAKARYEALRTVLAAVLVTVVLASLILILLTGRDVARQGEALTIQGAAQARSSARVETLGTELVRQTEALTRQGDTLEALLASQESDRADRAKRLAAAIGELTKVQQAQLDRHDSDVTARLQRILDEIGKLQTPPRVIRLPMRMGPPTGLAPRKTAPRPATAPRRTVAPRPAPPPPCDKSGKSGRCRK